MSNLMSAIKASVELKIHLEGFWKQLKNKKKPKTDLKEKLSIFSLIGTKTFMYGKENYGNS